MFEIGEVKGKESYKVNSGRVDQTLGMVPFR